MGILSDLIDKGFDMSVKYTDDNVISVKRSGCAALVINGTPCHETGCHNKVVTFDCFNCGYPVPRGECCGCNEPVDLEETEDVEA